MDDNLGPQSGRVYAAVRERILRGTFPPDTKLPPHSLLAREFGVALMTTRQALAQLEREGLVACEQGRGTFVRTARPSTEADTLLQAVLSSATHGIAVYDCELRYTLWNPVMEELTGMRAEEVIGQRAQDLFPHLREGGVYQLLERALAGETSRSRDVPYHVPPTGRSGWVTGSYGPLRNVHGQIVGVIGMIKDITERKRAENALRESEERYRELFENANDVVFTINLAGDFTSINRAGERVSGYRPEEALRMNIAQVVAPKHLELARRMLQQKLTASTHDLQTTYELEIVAKDGRRVPLEVSTRVIWRDGQPVGVQGIGRDMTERRQVAETLRFQALHDSLTQLPNRVLLQDRLQQALLSAYRDRSPVSVLLMDLDGFKEVNDTFGHQYGDILLRQVAERLRHAVREPDTVARLGGDEFAAVLTRADQTSATLVARRIQAALDQPFVLEDQRVDVRASIGISLHPDHGEDVDTLLRTADVAMYLAKKTGGGFTFYAPEQDQHSPTRFALVGQLRDAIERNELLLHFQPKVSLKATQIDAVEALVRWQHPKYGLLQPDSFIPAVEDTALIKPLSTWILNEALRHCHLWQEAQLDVRVGVNLSVRNLQDAQLVHTIARLLHRWGVPASRLQLEITESAIMADPARTMQVVTRLHDIGVSISIDDFGTGYSSLAYLKQLPADEIKIDRSFVMDMTDDDMVIVRSVIDLGHNLGLRVAAEGVENRETLDLLAEMGCDAAQGYFVSHPLPAEDVPCHLSKRSASGALTLSGQGGLELPPRMARGA